jgi:hypothetical protein
MRHGNDRAVDSVRERIKQLPRTARDTEFRWTGVPAQEFRNEGNGHKEALMSTNILEDKMRHLVESRPRIFDVYSGIIGTYVSIKDVRVDSIDVKWFQLRSFNKCEFSVKGFEPGPSHGIMQYLQIIDENIDNLLSDAISRIAEFTRKSFQIRKINQTFFDAICHSIDNLQMELDQINIYEEFSAAMFFKYPRQDDFYLVPFVKIRLTSIEEVDFTQ